MPQKRIIGITGTKGKTSTAYLLRHLLSSKFKTVIGGVPGNSLFDWIGVEQPHYIIAEYSSFDLDLAKSSPHIAILTSFFADHLNRYLSMAAYRRAKANIFAFQTGNDIAVFANAVDQMTFQNWTKGRVIVSKSWKISAPIPQIHPQVINLASTVAQHLGISSGNIIKKLRTFQALPHRREFVLNNKKFVIINDSTASNPKSAIESIKYALNLLTPLYVITGGNDKNFPRRDMEEYMQILQNSKIHTFILPGTMRTRNLMKWNNHFTRVLNMEDALNRIKKECKFPATILLAPGGTSFHSYRNEFERGDDFRNLIRKYFSK